jgi:hypothetical protein
VKRAVLVVVALLVALLAGGGLWLAGRMRGPHPDYRLDRVAVGEPGPADLHVGVAVRDITPDLGLYDPWVDTEGNGRYMPKQGDTYEDRNGNGRFDAVWIGGFGNNRPAKGVLDPLWARALALRSNGVTVVMVTIDSVGICQEHFIDIRQAIDPALGIDHVLFSSTHTHQAPDTIGIWSYSILRPRLDHAYLGLVRRACAEAVEEAVRSLESADLWCGTREIPPDTLAIDTRKPDVQDPVLNALRFARRDSGETIATLVNWGNHPEALGSKNSLLSSDFCHPLREAMEKGLPEPNGLEGFGGVCLYFQGNVGGLMTPLRMEIADRDGVRAFREEGPDKCRALGERIALEADAALRGPGAWRCEEPRLAVAARTFLVELDGLYKYAIMLGLVHPGYYGGKTRTEVNAVRLGDVDILTCPGELYPEIAEGRVEAPGGADFGIPPVETPGLRALMGGRMQMFINLANDEVGYVIPKSQWDAEAPHTYGNEKSPYGEENSGGPEVGPTYYREAARLLQDFYGAMDGPVAHLEGPGP